MKIEDLKILIEEGEGLNVEFKESYNPKLAQDIVAFANSKGGKILIGVTDNGQIKSFNLTNKTKAEIVDLARKCEPSIYVSFEKVGDVSIIQIEEHEDKPYSCSSGYFKRFDGITQRLNQKEINAVFSQRNNKNFDEKILINSSHKDLSLQKIKKFLKTANINLNATNENYVQILKNFNLENSGHITTSGLLFFAKDISKFVMHSQTLLLSFKDTNRDDIFDKKDVRDDLLSQFNEAIFFLEKHLSRMAIIKGTKRIDQFEIPTEVLREAIANALIHRDYNISGTNLHVEVFPDRVEIFNPGSLPLGHTTKTIQNISIRRNEKIADMFSRLSIVERAGTGLGRMQKLLKEANLPPLKIKTLGQFFKIVIQRPRIHKIITEVKTLTSDKILALIEADPSTSIPQIASTLNMTARNIERHIQILKKNKQLKRIGSPKLGHWKIIK